MIVVDASVTVSWLISDEDTQPSADAYRRAVTGEELTVPAHWWMEVTNALVSAIRRGRTSVTEASEILREIEGFNVSTLAGSVNFSERVLHTAVTSRLTAYDAAYLLLAQDEDVPLATLDKQLRNAALTAGVKLLP